MPWQVIDNIFVFFSISKCDGIFSVAHGKINIQSNLTSDKYKKALTAEVRLQRNSWPKPKVYFWSMDSTSKLIYKVFDKRI